MRLCSISSLLPRYHTHPEAELPVLVSSSSAPVTMGITLGEGSCDRVVRALKAAGVSSTYEIDRQVHEEEEEEGNGQEVESCGATAAAEAVAARVPFAVVRDKEGNVRGELFLGLTDISSSRALHDSFVRDLLLSPPQPIGTPAGHLSRFYLMHTLLDL